MLTELKYHASLLMFLLMGLHLPGTVSLPQCMHTHTHTHAHPYIPTLCWANPLRLGSGISSSREPPQLHSPTPLPTAGRGGSSTFPQPLCSPRCSLLDSSLGVLVPHWTKGSLWLPFASPRISNPGQETPRACLQAHRNTPGVSAITDTSSAFGL